MNICLEFTTVGGVDFLTTDDQTWGPYGHPQATRVAQRLPESTYWIPDMASYDISYMEADEDDQQFASKTEAVAWIRDGVLPCDRSTT